MPKLNNFVCKFPSEKAHRGRYELVIYEHHEPYSIDNPYRAILGWMQDYLARQGQPITIHLPDPDGDDDPVSGTMEYNGEILEVAFDNALGFISVFSPDRALLIRFAKLIHNEKPVLAP